MIKVCVSSWEESGPLGDVLLLNSGAQCSPRKPWKAGLLLGVHAEEAGTRETGFHYQSFRWEGRQGDTAEGRGSERVKGHVVGTA